MKSAGTLAVILLLPIFVVGCKHKTQAAPPPAAQAPILPPDSISKNNPPTPPQLPPPETPDVKLPDKPPPPPPPAHHPHRTKPKPAPTTPSNEQPANASTGTTPATTQEASAGQPSEASPIGQLSTASDSANTPPRQKIVDQINSTENGLKGIKRSLSTEEQATVAQIKTFLEKAKQALAQDDLDGAQTLLTKAKVLLDELTKG